MRHGNLCCYPPTARQLVGFRSYLWGMETGHSSQPYSNLRQVSILPMRHGNPPSSQMAGKPFRVFRSYLWGMETKTSSTGTCNDSRVSILPMRHGNNSFFFYFWFLDLFRSYLWGMETTLRLCSSLRTSKFRSYLWGMETKRAREKVTPDVSRFDPTYEAWKLCIEI